MRLTGKTQTQLLLQNLLYYGLLFIIFVLLAWLSLRYSIQSDWSANNRNSLRETSQATLQQLPGPVAITVFIGEDELTRKAIRELVARYQRHKNDLDLVFINPETNPTRARALGVAESGELMIEYGGKTERLQHLTEQTFTSALQRLARGEERWAVFLTGHGERDPYGQANFAYSEFTRRLTDKGFQVITHTLLENASIPDNTHVLVIADTRSDYLPGEIAIIKKYLEDGGNLLWLTEPGETGSLQTIGTQLGISLLPGVIVDASTEVFGIGQPDFAIVMNYPNTPITANFSQYTLFPQAAGLNIDAQNILGLTPKIFLQTLPRSWTETGPITGTIQFDENTDEISGPITLGVLLETDTGHAHTHEHDNPDSQNVQRIAVISDADFLSNAYLGNGGNLELGLNVFNWLSRDDILIDIKPVSAPDTQLTLSDTQLIVIAILFLVALPLGFIVAGISIWLKRRR
jgi:ABC-type uncharacterized transport system involved in gliding motility auxiliary subunit